MLTNRRSTMPLKHKRMPSWHAGAKTIDAPHSQAIPTYTVDNIPRSLTPSIMTSTTPNLPGYKVTRLVGAIHGTASLTHKVPKSFIKSLSSSVAGSWGEPKSLTEVLYQARDQAIERMTKDAIDKGANAVLGLQIRETEVMGCVVVSVSATACLVEKERSQIKRDSAQESTFG
ncbi:YjfJ protein [Stagonosporopsis vannaccii]|nr:YjfJ protein [Stagonosporopsis vannaccii]